MGDHDFSEYGSTRLGVSHSRVSRSKVATVCMRVYVCVQQGRVRARHVEANVHVTVN